MRFCLVLFCAKQYQTEPSPMVLFLEAGNADYVENVIDYVGQGSQYYN